MFQVRFHGRGGQGAAECPCGAIEMMPEPT
jgi:hypothetical protein